MDDISRAFDVHSLRDKLTKAADWLDFRFNPSKPSVDFARLTTGRSESPTPKVTRFASSPIFTKEGSLLVTPQVTLGDQIFLLPHGFNTCGHSPKNPTPDEVKDARELLLKMIVNFPFESDSTGRMRCALPFERLSAR